MSIIRDDLGGKESARHGGHDEQVNKNHYYYQYYQVETNQDKKNIRNTTTQLTRKCLIFLRINYCVQLCSNQPEHENSQEC